MRIATCQCGQLSVECPDQQLIHTQCACRECQRRTGAPSAFQLHFKSSELSISGDYKTYTRESANDEDREVGSFFCPNCGSTVWLSSSWSEAVFGEPIYQVSLGCFGDIEVVPPEVSIWCCNLPSWTEALAAKEFQMDKQPETVEGMLSAMESLGKR